MEQPVDVEFGCCWRRCCCDSAAQLLRCADNAAEVRPKFAFGRSGGGRCAPARAALVPPAGGASSRPAAAAFARCEQQVAGDGGVQSSSLIRLGPDRIGSDRARLGRRRSVRAKAVAHSPAGACSELPAPALRRRTAAALRPPTSARSRDRLGPARIQPARSPRPARTGRGPARSALGPRPASPHKLGAGHSPKCGASSCNFEGATRNLRAERPRDRSKASNLRVAKRADWKISLRARLQAQRSRPPAAQTKILRPPPAPRTASGGILQTARQMRRFCCNSSPPAE